MKEVTRCARCANAAIKGHFGFSGVDELYCSDRSGTVSADDGCTFGTPGIPKMAVDKYEINLGDDAATRNCDW